MVDSELTLPPWDEGRAGEINLPPLPSSQGWAPRVAGVQCVWTAAQREDMHGTCAVGCPSRPAASRGVTRVLAAVETRNEG